MQTVYKSEPQRLGILRGSALYTTTVIRDCVEYFKKKSSARY